jgi:hypothetical protein
MATRTTSRQSTAKSKGATKKGSAGPKQSSPPLSNREYVNQKLVQLMKPVLDQYGISAFNELAGRIETTIREFSSEVDSLFSRMVDQSREDYEKMKSLLEPQAATDEECDEKEKEKDSETSEQMSDLERRLEEKEKKKNSNNKDETVATK